MLEKMAFRRSGARLLSLGSEHGDLIMTISNLKNLRQATKNVITAQNDTIDGELLQIG